MRPKPWLLTVVLIGFGLSAACSPAPEQPPAPTAAQAPAATTAEQEFKLWDTEPPKPGAPAVESARQELRVIPGNETEATEYYKAIRPALAGFPQATLADSSISDMLIYYGFPALSPDNLEAFNPAVIMDFERLRKAIATPEFEAAYRDRPLQAGEILVSRFFAPKIINVRDPFVNGVPEGGFGWRKVLRFRARDGSKARGDGLDGFYLLFNFTSGAGTAFPEKIHAGQIQAMLVPAYPTAGKHRDAYFFVYQSLASETPGKMGFFLNASFDLATTVPLDGKYYVPRSCGQCHGTEKPDQRNAKVNYLDTDHWIDRTGDDFKNVPADNVLVDGAPSYATFRQLNGDIEKQNDAVVKQSGGASFALLAVRKWLELHGENQPDASRHVPPLRRGFVANAGDAVWTQGLSPDDELLPLLNQQCFRCHSSVKYHVFQKQAVIARKTGIAARVKSGIMPQGRVLDQATKQKIIDLVDQLK